MSRDSALVSADWAEKNLDTPGVVFVEVDEDVSAYDKGHIDGAVRLDWKTELQDQVRRDFVNKEQFEKLLSGKGIGNDDTIVLYGGNNNWFASYAYCTSSCMATTTSSFSTAAARSGSSTAVSWSRKSRSARLRPTPPSSPTPTFARSATRSSKRSAS